jgi:hypothetical protein
MEFLDWGLCGWAGFFRRTPAVGVERLGRFSRYVFASEEV